MKGGMNTMICGLLFSCPYDNVLPSCIFYLIRKKTIKERINIIKNIRRRSNKIYGKSIECVFKKD